MNALLPYWLTLCCMYLLFRFRLAWTTRIQLIAIDAILQHEIALIITGQQPCLDSACWNQMHAHHVVFWDILKWRFRAFYPDL